VLSDATQYYEGALEIQRVFAINSYSFTFRNNLIKLKISGNICPPTLQLVLCACIYMTVESVISGSLSPRHGASSGCGWMNSLRIWRVAADTLNKQSRIADKEWSSSLGAGRGANNSSP
jgi:hypothetical protein